MLRFFILILVCSTACVYTFQFSSLLLCLLQSCDTTDDTTDDDGDDIIDSITTSANVKHCISISSIKGRRKYMEDEYIVSSRGNLVGVFDGHGGSNVSKYVKKTLYSSFLRQLTEAGPWSDKAISQALIDCLCKVNTDILHINRWSHQGSTAAIVYVNYQQKKGCKDTDNDTSEYSIITANIGDSRIVLARGKKAIPLTVDHKPDNILEKVRIEKVGGHVVWHGLIRNGRPIVGSGVHRVNGNLSLSRALGDKAERPFISSIPDILITDSDAHDRFIILATDGLWDVFTSDEIVAFVYEILATVGTKKASIKSTMATMLTEEALRRGSSDNITALVIWLR